MTAARCRPAMRFKSPWTWRRREQPFYLSLLPLAAAMAMIPLRSSHSFVVRTTTIGKKRSNNNGISPSTVMLFHGHPVRGEEVPLGNDDVLAGVASVRVVETEPGIRLRCLEYYNTARDGGLGRLDSDNNDAVSTPKDSNEEESPSGSSSSRNFPTDRDVILLLHGFPDVPMTWNGVARNLVRATGADTGGGEDRERIVGGSSGSSRRIEENSFMVVCPELRGFSSCAAASSSSSLSNENGRTGGGGSIAAFSRESIVNDVDSLRRYYCGEQGSFRLLVGHDWGGGVAWSVLEDQELPHRPRIAQAAAILNLPHPLTFSENIVRWRQLRNSWYMFAFQVPVVSEWLLGRNDGSFLREAVVPNLRGDRRGNAGTRGGDVDELREYYSRTLSRPGFGDEPVRYYRAAALGLWGSFGACPQSYPKGLRRFVRLARKIGRALYGIGSKTDDGGGSDQNQGREGEGNDHDPFSVVLQTPVLVLWGSKDPYLGEELATPPTRLVPKLRGPIYFRNSGHWVHWDDEEEVSKELLKFISES